MNYEFGFYVFMLAAFLGFELIRNVSPLLHTPLMSLTNAISAISVVGAILITGEKDAPSLSLVLGFIAIFATILPFGLFLYGLRHITPSLASLTATLEPVVGSAAAMALLHERLGAVQITGGLAIVAAVSLIQTTDLSAARREELLPPAPD